MRVSIIFVLAMMLACQTQNNKTDQTNNTPEKEVIQSTEPVASKSTNNTNQENEQCHTDVCLQLRNHDAHNKSFEIYMINMVPVFGFQCDLPGIQITSADGGLLKENEYQTSNSASRILSFSLQARSIPIGGGILTTIYYSDPAKEVCMTEIIFAGIGGSKLKNDIPECMKLN
tara:strand:+ start:333 stop:851 length:519 start_codon:yes stop_codon:yes gene_type:complete